MKALCISAISSNQGKTVLSTALLHHFKTKVRPYKIGPDYIDPQFHEAIAKTPSINLDTFMMTQEQVQWIFNQYANKEYAILEGVMGFYDGMDKGCSAYDVTKLLKVPTVLLLDGSGSYITISAVLKGLKTYKDDNTIKGVVLNKLSSKMHYSLIKNQIEKDFDDIKVLGWIQKDLKTLGSTHLGLDLAEANEELLNDLSNEVLENIDLEILEEVATFSKQTITNYPFEHFDKVNKKITVVKDKNFSFIYHDNIEFLKELFSEVEIINACNDETISKNSDVVYLPGGYVETDIAYERIKHAQNFKNSLIKHAKNKKLYAECTGLLYLSNQVDDKIMSGILDVSFELKNKRSRLGYYYATNGLKGHAFHYTAPIDPPKGVDILSKKPQGKGEYGSWQKDNVYGSYLHTTFRNNLHILKDYFGI